MNAGGRLCRPQRWFPAAALWRGGLGLAPPCASAKRFLLLPEVFDDCSLVDRMFPPRDRASIREMNETVFALSFLETGGTVDSESL